MLLDKQNLLADGMPLVNIPAALTTLLDAVPTTPGNSINLQTFGRRRGPTLRCIAMIHGADAAAATSLRIILYVSSAPAAKTNAVQIADSGVILLASMKAGYEFPLEMGESFKMTPSAGAAPAYIVGELVQAGVAFTGAGLLTIGIVPDGDAQTSNV